MVNDPESQPPRRPRQQSPIGLAFEAGSAVPRVLEDLLDVVDRRTACVLEQGRALLGGLGLLPARDSQLHPAPPPPPSPPPPPPPSPQTSASEPGAGASSAGGGPAAAPSVATDVPREPAPDVDELPIPSYDSLSASQVVPRLASLESDDLELIRRYEAAGRARRTILNRVAQLQDA